MINFRIVTKETSQLSKLEFRQIFHLKSQYWKYSDYEQELWFEKNIKSDDLHLLVFQGDELIAYLDAVNVEVSINSIKFNAIGIGNVCVDRGFSKKGVGGILMSCINTIIKQENRLGMLLCKNHLIEFYLYSHWKVVSPEKVYINNQPFSYTLMIYDPNKNLAVDSIRDVVISRSF